MVSVGIIGINELHELTVDGERVKWAEAVNDIDCGVALGISTDGGYYRYEMDDIYWNIDAASGADACDVERYYIRLLGYIPHYNR